MTELIFGIIIIALLIRSHYADQQYYIEREKLLKAIMAKNLPDYDPDATIKEPEEKILDEVELNHASDNLFEKHLKSIVNGQNTEREYTERTDGAEDR